jgi:uncharacterized protein
MPIRTSADVVRGYLEAIPVGDRDRVRASFAPEAVSFGADVSVSGLWFGPDPDFGEVLSIAADRIDPSTLSIEVGDILVDGDQVVAEWHSTAASRHGERYDQYCVGIFTVRDGTIRALREYFDSDHAWRVMYSSPN